MAILLHLQCSYSTSFFLIHNGMMILRIFRCIRALWWRSPVRTSNIFKAFWLLMLLKTMLQSLCTVSRKQSDMYHERSKWWLQENFWHLVLECGKIKNASIISGYTSILNFVFFSGKKILNAHEMRSDGRFMVRSWDGGCSRPCLQPQKRMPPITEIWSSFFLPEWVRYVLANP